jgi:acyl-CoA synthetase (NDP forming)
MHAGGELAGVATLRGRGLPVYGRLEGAVDGLRALLPRPAVVRPDPRPAPDTPLPARPTYVHARALLRAAGIPFEDGALARTDREVRALAADLAEPVALKAVSADLLHKTDAGGVALGLTTPDEAAAAAAAMRERVGLSLDGIFVERMAAPDGVDLVVGAHRDARFGPVILVGLGGVLVEILDDVAIALAPASPEHVQRLLRGLRGAALLEGARGAEPVDVAAVARIACTLGDILVGRPEIGEVEINPLRALPEGAVALDGRVIHRGQSPVNSPVYG